MKNDAPKPTAVKNRRLKMSPGGIITLPVAARKSLNMTDHNFTGAKNRWLSGLAQGAACAARRSAWPAANRHRPALLD